MNKRIEALASLTLEGKMYVEPVPTDKIEYADIASRIEREVDELCRYILNQEPVINEHIAFTGRLNFDGRVVGDAFKRGGHRYTQRSLEKYYLFWKEIQRSKRRKLKTF